MSIILSSPVYIMHSCYHSDNLKMQAEIHVRGACCVNANATLNLLYGCVGDVQRRGHGLHHSVLHFCNSRKRIHFMQSTHMCESR